jgi:DNA polymerase-3 subunit gamma/tau
LEKVGLTDGAAHAIARGAEGGMRDAQSMLDQLVAFCGETIAETDVLNIFGFTAQETISSLTLALLEKNTPAALEQIHQQADRGKDLTRLLADTIGHLRNLLIHKIDPSAARDVAPALLEALNTQAPLVTTERLINLIDQFAEVDARMKWASNKRLYLEIGVIKAVHSLEEVLLSDVIATLEGVAEPGGYQASQARPAAPPPTAAPIPVPAAPPVAASVPVTLPPPAVAAPAPPPIAPPDLLLADESSAAPAAPLELEPLLLDVPSTAPAKAGLSGAALWAGAVVELQSRKPLQAGFAGQGVFLEQRGMEIVIGFAPSGQMAKDSLNRPAAKSAVEEILCALSGEAIALKLETHADLIPPPPPPKPELPPRPAPAPKSEPPSTSRKEKPSAAPAQESAPPSVEIPHVDEQEFYNDPLIAAALVQFEATITSITPAAPKPKN